MAYRITDECIGCGICESECPNQAITEGDIIFAITPAKCTECVGSFKASQCAEVCPVDACIPNPDQIENKEQLLDKWRQMYRGQEPIEGTY